ncbi:MerR family transcriptional regulator [Azospirillum rugosum]|uniref:DNA-binding transcriptional MerR regulator n=1 Tax=Azospirillum rugosum TaxID=416170 RepID=A0ABS4SPX7_9PROT|nr:MerR family transcriptional regulator [Azospirillum rugosum]MBP2294613.1 DNA-binding transcriptional MerR regulator [Azospirillum rugosum]MDQ0528098.1 DNA-binding transcriptional MerR regulator [Azospirillum rugosum]
MRTHRSAAKSATAFRTISEVSTELDVPQHVLRFWESRFPQLRPLKRGGGRRYYRPEDVELLRRIQSLLYLEGYTIKGVQRLLKEGLTDSGEPLDTVETSGIDEADEPAEQAIEPTDAPDIELPSAAAGAEAPPSPTLPEAARREIEDVLEELKILRSMLAKAADSAE